MADPSDTVLAQIRSLAEGALKQAETPQPVVQALKDIASLANPQSGDTPEPSDPPQTDNQTL